jgi:hypothetical protein
MRGSLFEDIAVLDPEQAEKEKEVNLQSLKLLRLKQHQKGVRESRQKELLLSQKQKPRRQGE